jgi:hypothetical protein
MEILAEWYTRGQRQTGRPCDFTCYGYQCCVYTIPLFHVSVKIYTGLSVCQFGIASATAMLPGIYMIWSGDSQGQRRFTHVFELDEVDFWIPNLMTQIWTKLLIHAIFTFHKIYAEACDIHKCY